MALRWNNEETWKAFLAEAGVRENVSEAYTNICITNGLPERTVKHLTMSDLKHIDITKLGDILSILEHIKVETSS